MLNNVNAQKWLDENFPKEGTSEYKGYEGKRREEITELNVSTAIGLGWITKQLEGSLNLNGFDKLESFFCSNNQITELDVSQCTNLRELDCSKNHLTGLKIPESLEKLNCSENKLTSLDLSNLSNLTEIDRRGNNLIQEWVNKKYEKENKVTEIYLNEKGLEGELDLADFTELKEIYISHFVDKDKLKIKNKPERVKEIELVNSQEYVSKNHFAKEIDISNKNLEGDLDLSDFICLEKINITGNPKLGKITNKRKETNIIIANSQELLDREYPINENCRGEIDPDNKDKKREEIVKLNLTKKELKDELKLEGFTDLRVLECDQNQLTNLDVSTCAKLEILNCGKNCLSSLDLSNNKMLIGLYCWQNKLEELNISNCRNLKKLGCSSNRLTKLALNNNSRLETLDIADNKLNEPDLSFLTNLTDLKMLIVGNSGERGDDCNHFSGDLHHLKKMTKLKWLSCDNTDIDSKEIPQREKTKKVEILFSYRPNHYEFGSDDLATLLRNFFGHLKSMGWKNSLSLISVNQINLKNLEQLFTEETEGYKLTVEEVIEKAKSYYVKVKKAPDIPSVVLLNLRARKNLVIEQSSKLGEEKTEQEPYKEIRSENYGDIIYPDDSLVKDSIRDAIKPSEIPKKLYDIKDEKIIKTEERINKKITYATLSYVCNDWMKGHKERKMKDGQKFLLSPSSNRALDKAIKTCRTLEIDYLWMDKLCINQNDPDEKAEEVRNMYRNYDNSTVTLISINKRIQEGDSQEWDHDSLKVLEEIVDSDWFTRSWTFQEGWLSKHTIFMFDDMLIDGAFLAKVWAFNQSADAEGKYSSQREFEEETKKIATPIGWVRHEYGYDNRDRLTMSLHEALRGIKERRRGVPLDGIYTTLGLLHYGTKVNPKYKPRICRGGGNCSESFEDNNYEFKKGERENYEWGIESKDCRHEEEYKKWPAYTKEDAEKALIDVMREAVKAKCWEPLAWYGKSDEESGKSWLPKIKMDGNDKEGKNGSVEVWGGIDIECDPQSISLEDRTGKLKLQRAKRYYISNKTDNIMGVGGKSILGGVYSGTINIEKSNNDPKKIKLWGTKETLRGVNKGDYLIVPDEITKSDTPFAILVKGQSNCCKRIGLVELNKEDKEKLQGMETDSKMIVFDGKEENYGGIEKEFQTHIQIPPKGNN